MTLSAHVAVPCQLRQLYTRHSLTAKTLVQAWTIATLYCTDNLIRKVQLVHINSDHCVWLYTAGEAELMHPIGIENATLHDNFHRDFCRCYTLYDIDETSRHDSLYYVAFDVIIVRR